MYKYWFEGYLGRVKLDVMEFFKVILLCFIKVYVIMTNKQPTRKKSSAVTEKLILLTAKHLDGNEQVNVRRYFN